MGKEFEMKFLNAPIYIIGSLKAIVIEMFNVMHFASLLGNDL
jgi:hypothetical protein